ncbi:MAG: 23S rRNA (uracil(1939)-C(5))-methyltransferase RlmD [Myxococcota bacterium]
MKTRPHLPHSPRSDEQFEVEVTGLSLEGEGTAKFPALVGPQEERKDFVFYIRKAVPGDRVRVLVETRRKRRIICRIDEILEPSGMRAEPRCKHFGRRELPGEGCGGCTLQNLSYRHQLASKESTVKRLIKDAGLDPGWVTPVIGQDEPWYYRNKMEFSFGDTVNREFALGMYPKGYRYEVLNLDECYLQSEFAAKFLQSIRAWAVKNGISPYINNKNDGFLRTLTIREGKRTGERLVELMTTHAEETFFDGSFVPAEDIARSFRDVALDTAAEIGGGLTSVYWTQQRAVRGEPTRFIEHHLHGEPLLREQMHLPGDTVLDFDIHPRAFFQPNTLQAEVLYGEVLEKTGLLEESARHTVLDLYCGTGTIGMCMAPYADRVVGIELQPDAVENARQNAITNGIDNIEFFVGDVGDVLETEDFKAAAGEVDLVVVDPPRAGLLPGAREHLADIDASRLVYVSCNPTALARDLRDLIEAGWRVESIQPVDMFPHTYHIENVALLQK